MTPGPEPQGKIPKYDPSPEKITNDIIAKYSQNNTNKIITRLLLSLDSPPELVENYGRAMYEKGKLESKNITGYSYDYDEAWKFEKQQFKG